MQSTTPTSLTPRLPVSMAHGERRSFRANRSGSRPIQHHGAPRRACPGAVMVTAHLRLHRDLRYRLSRDRSNVVLERKLCHRPLVHAQRIHGRTVQAALCPQDFGHPRGANVCYIHNDERDEAMISVGAFSRASYTRIASEASPIGQVWSAKRASRVAPIVGRFAPKTCVTRHCPVPSQINPERTPP